MNRLVAFIAALLVAPAALAQEAAAPAAAPAAPAADVAPAGPDTAALEGKVTSLEEQVAELKSGVDALKRIKLSGYIQARYAWQEAAANHYGATPAVPPGQQNFFIRRGRIKTVYDGDLTQYVLQLDATPSGVGIKEGYATLKLPAGFAVDAGLQLFPFGYEVLVRSSADLDLLERARVTRAYLGGEYDLGVALRGAYGPLNFKVGVFNGNGIDAKTSGLDNDQLKDVIGRIGLDFGMVTGGVSGWYGKTRNYSSLAATEPSDPQDYDRKRLGADLQVFLDLLPIGGTALKGEYIMGTTTISDKNGGAGDLLGKKGNGWYGLLTQNVGSWNQVAVRFEEFTPDKEVDLSGDTNTKVKTQQELQAAVHTFIGGNYKLSLAYFHPLNGDKGAAAPSDPKTDQFIVQAQAKF
ncbi:MAG: porin [Anaeromyxobacter sp.]